MIVLNNNRIPIFAWVKEEGDIEPDCIEQANHLANLPFAHHHIALMPDTHFGPGMPIGSVLATEGVIIPNAVGVDIGCYDKDTEYLTPEGWRKFDSYNGEKVMQFDPKTNVGEFVKPLKYIKEKCSRFIQIKTKYGINQVLSDDHRCLTYKYDRGYKFDVFGVVSAGDIKEKDNNTRQGFRHRFLTTFRPRINTSIDLSDSELRLMVAVCADGSLISEELNKQKRCRIHIKKQRKIERLRKLLEEAGIGYFENGLDKINFIFTPPILRKVLSFWEASFEQLKIISDECVYWDGNQDNCFYTRKKEEADFINYVFSATGYRSTVSIDHRESGIDYRVFRYNNTKIGINGNDRENIKYIDSIDSYKYCFRVPSAFLVVRRKGNVVVSGNCGMSFAETNVPVKELRGVKTANGELIHAMIATLKRCIPTGFSHHKEPQESPILDNPPSWIEGIEIIAEQYERAKYQIGTLGGGNHFIELQENEKGNLCLMLHSGSRNLGYRIAETYNKKAKALNEKWHSKIDPSWQLAFLPTDSEEGVEYKFAMLFALEFAKDNRAKMLERFKNVVFNLIKKHTGFKNIEIGLEVNIHHNYAELEHHYGKNVWVHRKGAIRMRENEMGIIPGSMGTPSYIVSGKQVPSSFMSASHGAGRTMGRKQAERTLSVEQQKKALEKVVMLSKVENIIDECPGAYKDIDVVLENEADLVDIVMKLKPIASLKGEGKR